MANKGYTEFFLLSFDLLISCSALVCGVQNLYETFGCISLRISGSSPPNSEKMLGFAVLNLKFLAKYIHTN